MKHTDVKLTCARLIIQLISIEAGIQTQAFRSDLPLCYSTSSIKWALTMSTLMMPNTNVQRNFSFHCTFVFKSHKIYMNAQLFFSYIFSRAVRSELEVPPYFSPAYTDSFPVALAPFHWNGVRKAIFIHTLHAGKVLNT